MLATVMEDHTEAIKARDDRIAKLEGQNERLRSEKTEQLREKETAFEAGAAELELMYQRKLTAAAMQFKKLKDAFNDLVVAAKDDVSEAKAEAKMKEQEMIKNFDKERTALIKEQEILR